MPDERLLPHDINSEESLIGSLLIDPHSFTEVSSIVKAEDFFRLGHRYIFETISNFFVENKSIDHVSIANDLRERGLLDEIGGREILESIIRIVPTSVHAKQYATDVRESAQRRRLIEAGKQVAEHGFDTSTDVRESLASAEDAILRVRDTDKSSDLTLIKGTMDEHLDALSRPIGSEEDGLVSTGYSRLNEVMGGFYPGDMLVLAARPSIGKSMLALNFVLKIARTGKRVVVFSLEMGSYEVGMRLLAKSADVSMHSIRTRRLGRNERERLVNAVGELSDMQIYVDESSIHTTGEMRAKLLRLHRVQPIDFVVIDYIQLMTGTRNDQNRTQEVSEISRNIKSIARDLQLPVLAISQLNREVEKKASKPMLSNLRDSGSIEQDADVVMFIHREDKVTSKREWNMNNPGQPYPANLAELIIAKHRHGPTGSVTFVMREDRGIVEERIENQNYGVEQKRSVNV